MKKTTSPYFQTMIDDIDLSWFKLKGVHYPFRGRDFKELKKAANNFQEWGLCALWDCFMESDREWVVESGFSVSAFLSCLVWLVDNRTWKSRAEVYRKNMEEPISEEMPDILKGLVKEIKK